MTKGDLEFQFKAMVEKKEEFFQLAMRYKAALQQIRSSSLNEPGGWLAAKMWRIADQKLKEVKEK